MLWGAAWLRRASGDERYLDYIQSNAKSLGADENINEFGWDNKHAGLNVLVSKVQSNLQFLYIIDTRPSSYFYYYGLYFFGL